MAYWQEFISAGGSLVMVPAALAIFAWLAAGHAWRMAWLWGVLFSAGLAIVAATQMAFIGWGMKISALDFQGFSGHSMRSAAVMPVMFYLVLQNAAPLIRVSGVVLGSSIAALMGFAVSAHNTHSASEAIAGCMFGYAICLGFIGASRSMNQPTVNRAAATAIVFILVAALFCTTSWMTDQTYGWMTKAALVLSGSEKPYTRSF